MVVADSNPLEAEGMATLLPVSQNSVRLAVENSTDCIKVLDLEGRLEYMNEGGMCVMEIDDFGDFRGACWPDFWQGEENVKANRALDEARLGGVGRFQGYTATAKGNVRYWDVTVSPVPGLDGRAERLLSVSRDITAQREADFERERLIDEVRAEREKVAEAAAFLRLVTDRLPVRIAYVDRNLRYQFLNGEYARIFKRSVDDAVGRPVQEVVGQAAFDVARPALERALRGETVRFVSEVEYPFGTVWVEASFTPDVSEEGAVHGAVVHVHDVTERVQVERDLATMNERLEARVEKRTAELQRAVEEAEGFNYSISHDLRTPLRAVASTASILMEELGLDLAEDHRELLQRQVHNATRMGALIDDLLRLSRLSRAELKVETIDLTWVVRSVASGVQTPCTFEIQDGMALDGDPSLVRTLIHNLVDNACKFSPGGGTVRVGQDGESFWVKDQGVGFDMRFAAKVFRPFERLVADHEFPGTGMGLATVKKIVERHGGKVWAESEPGKGTTFSFTFRKQTGSIHKS